MLCISYVLLYVYIYMQYLYQIHFYAGVHYMLASLLLFSISELVGIEFEWVHLIMATEW